MLAIALAVLLSAPASVPSDKAFTPIPAEQTAGKSTGLEMRVIDYNGSTNGIIEVEVRNPTGSAVEFSAKGIYFVPNGNADSAPQRLGAVGPFVVKNDKGNWKRAKSTTIEPQATARMKLDVYCIDSHRSSPSSATSFHLGKDRMPLQIATSIEADAQAAAAPAGGVTAPAAKSSVQSEVWKNRDRKWIKLDGEGKQEAGK